MDVQYWWLVVNMDCITGRQAHDSCWKVVALISWSPRYVGRVPKRSCKESNNIYILSQRNEGSLELLTSRQYLLKFSLCFAWWGCGVWGRDTVGCKQEGGKRKGLIISAAIILFSLLISFARISLCIFSARAYTWKNRLPACLSLSLQKTQTRASSVSISMAADNHLIQLAGPALWGQDRSHWPTFEMCMSTVNCIWFNCWHTVVEIIL